MSIVKWLAVMGLAGGLAMAPAARAQVRPYIGFVYPAGGQQGTTFQIKLGGQSMDDVDEAIVTGSGVSVKIVQYYRPLGPIEMGLLNEQLRDLRRAKKAEAATMMSGDMMMSSATAGKPAVTGTNLISRIEKRVREYCNRPASAAIAALVYAEVTIAPDAAPGQRELRVVTPRGVSNPLVFYVGQLPEISRNPMLTSNYEVLGKEELALRKRPAEEVEDRITIPCTANGQVAPGEVNRYRFQAHKGQRLVLRAQARQLIPYIADAVPGWFQPVLALYDENGKEVAYDDDYRFKPDPIILYEVPKDGEYVFTIYDAIYRGREDFVYRVSIGELPFVTSIFPLGARLGESVSIKMKGWNLQSAELTPPAKAAGPGIHPVTASRAGFVSNRVPFVLDTLPETFDQEPNDDQAHAQKVKLPVIVNGRIDRTDDWDVFQFEGKAGESIVAEVYARRLDSPLDSVLKLTDAKGNILAFNDDREDLGSGVNTHHADSYLMAKLPADGTYYVHIGDTDRNGGEAYAYRLRISAPQPDFALRVVPSSLSLRPRNTGAVSIYAIRRDGFTGDIKLSLKNPPTGFTSFPVALTGTQSVTRLAIKTTELASTVPINLTVEGRATIQGNDVAHDAVPAEDRMQAFLWRHLVPAEELKVQVIDPSYVPPAKRIARMHVPSAEEIKAKTKTASTDQPDNKPKFTKKQVAGRLRQLKLLFEEGLLTDDFYNDKVAECEAAQ